MRVLFLGNNYHPISVAALQALLECDAFSVVAGVYDPRGARGGQTALRLYRERGALALARRVATVASAQARLWLRRAGLALPGFASLDELLLAYRAEHFRCRRVNARQSLRAIRELAPEVIAVANFSQILKPSLLAIPPRGCVNLHPSLLPKYRGPMPCYWVLRNGERVTGVTVHYVDAGVDSGDIVLQRAIPIERGETEGALQAKSARAGAQLLVDSLRQIGAGTAPRLVQDGEASYYSFPPRGASSL